MFYEIPVFAKWRKLGFGGGEGLRRPEPFQNYKGPIRADRDQMEQKNEKKWQNKQFRPKVYPIFQFRPKYRLSNPFRHNQG